VVTRDELRQLLWPADTFVDFDNSLSIAVRKLRQTLNDEVAKPRYIETLPRVGYRFIAPIEIAQPASEAPPSPTAAAAPERAIEPTAPDAGPPRRRTRRWAWGLIPGAIVLALVLWIPVSQHNRAANASIALRPAVAILGFRNLTARPDRNWESTALAEWLSTDLEDGGRLRTIPGESVAHTKSDLALPDVDGFSSSTLAKIRRNTGADYVVAGSFFDTAAATGGNVRLDLRMQDTRSGQTVLAVSRTTSPDDLPGLTKLAGMAIRQKLGVALAAAPPQRADASVPPYFEGLDKLRHFHARGARDLLEQAVAADPKNALAHHALSQAWAALGYAEIAKREAHQAWDLSGNLPSAERLSIEAGYRTASAEWDQAIRIYRQLRDLFPDDEDYGLRLAHAQILAGQPKDAQATLDRLRQLPPPAADDAAIQLVQSEAAGKLGEFEQARAFAAGAAAAAESRGAHILLAQARALECRNLIQLSRLEQAAATCQSAQQIYTRAGDRAGTASATGYLASTRFMLGDLDAAHTLYAQALNINREIGSEGTAAWERNGLANILWQEGDLAAARRQYQESLRVARLVSSRFDEADALGNIGFTWMLEGNLPQARDLFHQALALFQEMSDKAGVASVSNNLGHTMYFAGELPDAAAALAKALAAAREIGYKLDAADALAWMGRVSLAQARFDDARRQFDESVKLANETGNPVFVAQCRLAAAALPLATGRPAEAEAAARDSLALFDRQNRRRQGLEARMLLAEALLAQGKTAAAREALDQAAPLANSSQQLTARLEFDIVARRNLEAAIATAAQRGLVAYQLPARLALAELQLEHGNRTAPRTLEILEHDARSRGFEAIARQAAAARSKPVAHALAMPSILREVENHPGKLVSVCAVFVLLIVSIR